MVPIDPLIFDIVRGSCVDGPGIRTVIFLKGCPLKCVWCHNPESQSPLPQMVYYPDKCTRCTKCRLICPNGAINLEQPYIIDTQKCSLCGQCEQHCDNLALKKLGKQYSQAQLLENVLKDQSYYLTSDGGVTFSGGEPLLHMDFLARTAKELKRAGLHIAVETCGYFDYRKFKYKVLPWVDLILFDIKLIDPKQHKRFTGKSNRIILENFKQLGLEKNVEIRPRVPLVPGITATPQNLRQTMALFYENGVVQYDVLPYNSSTQDKWMLLGRPSPAELPLKPLTMATEKKIRKKFERYIKVPPAFV